MTSPLQSALPAAPLRVHATHATQLYASSMQTGQGLSPGAFGQQPQLQAPVLSRGAMMRTRRRDSISACTCSFSPLKNFSSFSLLRSLSMDWPHSWMSSVAMPSCSAEAAECVAATVEQSAPKCGVGKSKSGPFPACHGVNLGNLQPLWRRTRCAMPAMVTRARFVVCAVRLKVAAAWLPKRSGLPAASVGLSWNICIRQSTHPYCSRPAAAATQGMDLPMIAGGCQSSCEHLGLAAVQSAFGASLKIYVEKGS